MVVNYQGVELGILYRYQGGAIGNAVNYNGRPLYSTHPDYNNYAVNYLGSKAAGSLQSLCYYEGFLFQFSSATANGTLTRINYPDFGNPIQLSGLYGHPNSSQFADDFYDGNDTFPLCYVSTITNVGTVNVTRLKNDNTTELVKIIKFTEADGYQASAAIDNDNDIIFSIGYTLESALNNPDNTNKMIVSIYDNTNLIDNGDGTFTPTLINRYTRDFIYCRQDQKYHSGFIWIASGSGTPLTEQKIYAMDPYDGRILYTINFNVAHEIEGFYFIDDDTMIVVFQGGDYYIVSFDNT